jgi:hypothetical protein
LYADDRIIPPNAALVVGRVVVRAFVLELAFLFGHTEAMCESGRYVELAPVLRRQRHGDPAAERRGATPDIDRHVERRPADDSDKLPLRPTELVVESPQASRHGTRVVVLDELPGKSRCGVTVRMITLQEPSPRIRENGGFDDQNAF